MAFRAAGVLSAILAMFTIGCGASNAGESDGGPALAADASDRDSSINGGDSGSPDTVDDLDTAFGCQGVYNPNQLLDYHLTLAESDWNALRADTSNSIYFPAEIGCGDEPTIAVGVRRKRSGGAEKVGLKVDINYVVPDQTYFGLRKLSLENGVSEGDTEDGAEIAAYLAEYLAWRMMVLSGAVSGRAAFANLYVNGRLLGVYVNVEQVDKRFLETRFGDDTGWLYKKSGGANDGFKTHEIDGLVDPYATYFCFWGSGNACPAPPSDELAQTLPDHLDIEQLLRHGAVNAIMANADSLLFKDNNYYWYDWAGKREYIAWDLDTVMREHSDVFSGGGGGGGTTAYTAVLFSNWEQDYTDILSDLLAHALTLDAILSELDRAATVAGAAFDSDPYVSGSTAEARETLRTYWEVRHAEVQAQVDAH